MRLPLSTKPAGNTRSNDRSTARKLGSLVLAVSALLQVAPHAHAFPSILNAFNSRYPGSDAAVNASCHLCHGSSDHNWNEYGYGLLLSGWNFAGLESLPSVNLNGGTTYLDEITASTQPGWTTGANNNLYSRTGLISSTLTPPAGIAGNLDPPLGNMPPVANDDAYSTPFQTQLIVVAPGVLGNDTDAEGAALSAALQRDVTNGTLSLNEDGSFSYTPNAGFIGTDSLTYVANDGADDSNVATVTITVGIADTDGDGILDNQDNCLDVANADQRDTNGDGYGNICDPDFNDDNIVGPYDLSAFKAAYGSTTSPDQDLNGDGVVGPYDLSSFKSFYGKPPGPSCCGVPLP
jgi:VCBS repeat-containing protein